MSGETRALTAKDFPRDCCIALLVASTHSRHYRYGKGIHVFDLCEVFFFAALLASLQGRPVCRGGVRETQRNVFFFAL